MIVSDCVHVPIATTPSNTLADLVRGATCTKSGMYHQAVTVAQRCRCVVRSGARPSNAQHARV